MDPKHIDPRKDRTVYQRNRLSERLSSLGGDAETLEKGIRRGEIGGVRGRRLLRPVQFAIGALVAKAARLDRILDRRYSKRAKAA